MARPIESNLYQALLESQFAFVERGERTTHEIYDAVKARFPELCDDEYSCIDNCRSGNKQPEWNHVVRSALQRLKSPHGSISNTRRGVLLFS